MDRDTRSNKKGGNTSTVRVGREIAGTERLVLDFRTLRGDQSVKRRDVVGRQRVRLGSFHKPGISIRF